MAFYMRFFSVCTFMWLAKLDDDDDDDDDGTKEREKIVLPVMRTERRIGFHLCNVIITYAKYMSH